MEELGIEFILDVVGQQLPAAGVEFLMIGGHAVNHYGYSRATMDIDFMIAAIDVETVRSIMKNAGFLNISQSENVVFFSNPDLPVRVDFLQVDHKTMLELLNRSQRIEYGGQELRVPCLENLIAMKLFALKSGSPKREEKDFPDIVNLAVEHQLDLEETLKPLCNQFADENIYIRLVEHIRGASNA
ncbi:nucleotidyltransferase [Pontiellaceae bacterium B12227]|nr:nucleotidyltransferase [Pontiellaceae bacterium B12227]